MTALLCLIFFASGASALLFETLWFRQAGLAFGNSVWASSLVLAGFMGGLALGNTLAARYGNRLRNPVRAYALAEVAIGLTGIGLVYLLPVFGVALAPWFRPLEEYPWLLNTLRLSLAFLLLVIPSAAMGITLPLLTKTLMGYDRHFGRVLGRLYGWNTLGAVFGVVIGETVLIGAVGVHGTAITAGALNLFAAAVAGRLSTRPSIGALAPSSSDRPAIQLGGQWQWLIAAFLSGFCLLALEVVWFRFLVLFVFGDSLAFAMMLAVVLAGIALGGLTAGLWLRRMPDAYRFSAPIALAAGLLCMASYAAFPLILKPLALQNIRTVLDILHLNVPLMFPVSFLSGIFFTLVGAALRNHLASETAATGVLTLANTTGAALGSLAGGFVFLPIVGMERSFFILAVLYGAIGLLMMWRSLGPRRVAYAAATVFLVGLALFPFGLMKKTFIPIPVKRWFVPPKAGINYKIASVREGLTSTIIYLEAVMLGRPVSYVMFTNSHSMSQSSFDARRYMKLFLYWPEAVHPKLKHALLICFGVGNTAKALTDTKSLDSIDVVDISRDVLTMNRVIYPNKAHSPLSDPRVRVHIEDGRYFLQTTAERFDLITGEPPPPQAAGVVNLYTREYFQLMYNRLSEGGMVTYWLPLNLLTDVSTKAILHAFCDVFKDCSLWNGMGRSLMMVGTRHARGPVSEQHFIKQWQDPVVAAEMKRLGFERPEQLGALFIGDADYLKGIYTDTPPLTDNYPKLIEAPFTSKQEAQRLFLSFTNVAAAQTRFQQSPLIKDLWPERLRETSLPYFKQQNILNAYLYGATSYPLHGLEGVYRLLTHSSLSTPVLWPLGSDSDIQRIVDEVGNAQLAEPLMQLHLGIRLLSERKYAEAANTLARAERMPQLREQAFGLHIFALCMAGQTDQAQRLAQEQYPQILREKGFAAASLNDSSLPPPWVWMKKMFGIDPFANTSDTQGSAHAPFKVPLKND